MQKATVAIEDRRFYQHGGVDYEGIVRAALRDLKSGRVVEGGSTITQQLVRNLYIPASGRFKRKVKEACLALKLDRDWSKDRILEAWLNQVYFGNQAYGVEAAAQTYFSKPAKDLTLVESALLAGPAAGAVALRPVPAPRAAFARARRGPQGAARHGRHLHVQYQDGAPRQEPAPRAGPALHDDPGAVLLQLRPRPADRQVRRPDGTSGGLSVYTTIDPTFQRAARNAIRETLNQKHDPASALVSINPATARSGR